MEEIMRKFGLTISAILILALMLTGCERREAEPPAPQVPAEPPPAAPAPDTARDDDPAAAATALGFQIDMTTGEQVNAQACATCHAQGIAGAPITGDAEAWAPRIDKGMETLIRHSIEGFQGNAGVMPPRGGVATLTDDEVASAVVYMVEQSQ
jgi:cytochrome c5